MKRRLLIALLLTCLVVAVPATTSGAPTRLAATPSGFFGIAPQTSLTPEDARYMKAGGIETVRLPLMWSSIQPTARGGYNWSSFDEMVTVAANAGLRVLPSVASIPRWLSHKETTLPVNNAKQRTA